MKASDRIKFLAKHTGAILAATLIVCVLLEIGCRFLGLPTGGSRFVESTVMREKLSHHKPAGEFRIFIYGESTMVGAHYAPVSSPARWLEAYLKDYLPRENIRVVNFARMGHGIDFAYRTLCQTLPYRPDLAIFYQGHNDFLYKNHKRAVEAKRRHFDHWIGEWARKSRLISAVLRAGIRLRLGRKTEVSEDRMEFERIEMPPLGIGEANATPRNEPLYWENIDFFRERVRSIARLARRENLPVLFIKPVSNLKDFAPFHSVHLKKMAPEALSIWENLYEQGKKSQQQDYWQGARDFYAAAHEIDGTYADLSFRLGQVYLALGDIGTARAMFKEARDHDVIIFRATREILASLTELAAEEEFPLIDIEGELLREVPEGILGEPVIEDNVHLSIPGHSILGRRLALEIAERNWIAPKASWQFQRERPYGEIVREVGVDRGFLITAHLKMVNFFGSRFENRVRFARKALDLDPKNERGLRYLAWTYWLMGEKDLAVETYRHLGELHPAALEEVFKFQPDIKKALGSS